MGNIIEKYPFRCDDIYLELGIEYRGKIELVADKRPFLAFSSFCVLVHL